MPETSTSDALRPIEAPRPKPKRLEKFGERLRREREMRGISLEEIAEATKIGTRSLRALEQENFSQLPGGIFNKGFVRAYARFLGIDEEQAVSDYLAAMEEQQQSAEPAHLEEIARQVQAQREQISKSQNNTLMWFGVALIAAIVGLGIFGWHAWQKDKEKAEREKAEQVARQQQQAQDLARQQAAAQAQLSTAAPDQYVTLPASNPAPTGNAATGANTSALPQQATSQPATSTASPAGAAPQQSVTVTQPKQANPTPGTASDAAVNLSLKATARTWISVTVDGGKTTTMTLDPNDPKMATRTFQGTERVFLITGNPAGLDATLNGKPVGSLGPVGQRRQVMFTPQGIQ